LITEKLDMYRTWFSRQNELRFWKLWMHEVRGNIRQWILDPREILRLRLGDKVSRYILYFVSFMFSEVTYCELINNLTVIYYFIYSFLVVAFVEFFFHIYLFPKFNATLIIFLPIIPLSIYRRERNKCNEIITLKRRE
jgi:hypothetical protein